MMTDDFPTPIQFNWKKNVYYGLAAIALLSGLAVIFVSKRGNAESEYAKANAEFLKWDQTLQTEGQEFSNLQTLMKKHPELHAHYDAKIAHNLIAMRSAEEAQPYLERTQARTQQPYYSEYGATSLKISAGNYEQALEEALALKHQLQSDTKFSLEGQKWSTLFAFNLMRIALLYQELGDFEQELTAWQELKKFGSVELDSLENDVLVTSDHEGVQQLLSHFTVQDSSLLDYIRSREEEIGKL